MSLTGVNLGQGPTKDPQYWTWPTGPGYRWMKAVDSLLNLDVLAGTGDVYYVDSGTGSSSNNGKSWQSAMATIAQAMAKCTASNGDQILVAPGHSETFTATGLTCSVIGVHIIGIGNGFNAPIINMNHATAMVSITAASTRITNIQFRPHITSVAKAINIAASYCTIDGCRFLHGEDGAGVDEFTDTIINAAGSNETLIAGNLFETQRGDASVSGVKLSDASVGVRILGNTFSGAYSSAAIYGITAACTAVDISDNVGADVVEYAGTTGIIENNGYPHPTFLARTNGVKIGNIYYVNGGSDGPTDNYGNGTTPSDPKRTLTAAVGKCVTGHNDYIFVLNYGSNARAVETWPVAISKDMVHVIGLSANPASKWAVVTATGTNANAFTVTGQRCEIAQLEIGGTATGSGCGIAVGNVAGVWGLYVHDCWFGVADGAGTNGILVGSTFDAPYLTVENCVFGNGLTGTAILLTGVATKFQFKNNEFRSNTLCISVAGSCVGGSITGNKFQLDADTNGDAITLAAGTSLIWIDGNSAHYGKTAMANKPYTDGSTTNTWGINYKGITPALPAT